MYHQMKDDSGTVRVEKGKKHYLFPALQKCRAVTSCDQCMLLKM